MTTDSPAVAPPAAAAPGDAAAPCPSCGTPLAPPRPSPVRPPVSGDEARYPLRESLAAIPARAAERVGEALLDHHVWRGELTLRVAPAAFRDLCLWLRDDDATRFDYLSCLTVIDWLRLAASPRFESVIHLYSLPRRHRLTVKVPVPDDTLTVPSVTDIWPTADWHEREAFDLYGVRYDGHPSLTRIIMPDDWDGHPLRKDFPLGGAPSFYYKASTQPYAGEPKGMIPRIRTRQTDV